MASPSSRQVIALVAPRPGTISPWSSKASDIAHNCGLNQVLRLERGTLWRLSTAEAQPTEQFCVNDQGFSLHAEVRCAINQRHKLEHLCRYITRPVLSTISVDVPGYPFGSVVPYCLDRQGRRVIHISRVAQHCKSHHGRPPIPAERSPDQQVQALESKKPGVRHSPE